MVCASNEVAKTPLNATRTAANEATRRIMTAPVGFDPQQRVDESRVAAEFSRRPFAETAYAYSDGALSADALRRVKSNVLPRF
jgi:hypothetical protein